MIAGTNRRLRVSAIAATLGLLFAIGLIDFWLSPDVSLLPFYFLPIALAVMALGWRFGATTALLSVAAWTAGDLASGLHYASAWLPIWNAVIALLTYFVLIWLLFTLLQSHRTMEARVRQRTEALTAEIAERQRLEIEVLEIGERERRRIGRELHDGLGQHLTGTAITGQVLVEKLVAEKSREVDDAVKIVSLVKTAINQTRLLAKGLLLVEVEPDGLQTALRQLGRTTAEQSKIVCLVECQGDPKTREGAVATHLYRIAQEALRNALSHAKTKRVLIRLFETPDGLTLTVRDYGVGLPKIRKGPGLGLRIMAHRASIIGANFAVETPPDGGTLVICHLSQPVST
ncbi:MAG TPA: ATP-binding protein [Opitutaceae bacterium]